MQARNYIKSYKYKSSKKTISEERRVGQARVRTMKWGKKKSKYL